MIDSVLVFLAAIFFLGSGFIWFVGLGFFFLMVALTETDHDGFALLAVILCTFLFVHGNDFVVQTDPLFYVKYFGIYFVAGTVWSIVKWVSYLFKQRDKFKEIKLRWLQNYNDRIDAVDDLERLALDVKTPIPEGKFDDFASSLRDNSYLGGYGSDQRIRSREDIIPNASNFKGRIVSWIVWWPFSAFWTLLDDPIRRIANAIYNSLQGLYRNIADRIFADFGA